MLANLRFLRGRRIDNATAIWITPQAGCLLYGTGRKPVLRRLFGGRINNFQTSHPNYG